MWPTLTGEQFFAVLRRWGWTLIYEGDFWTAYRDQGMVGVKLRFLQDTVLTPNEVARWADHFGLTLDNL